MNQNTDRGSLTRFAWLSIAAAVATIVLKLLAYRLTGSVGLLSDAIESGVNLVGGIMALAMLTVAARPPDEEHQYGHGKAEYFSSGVEGSLIFIAAISIGYAALGRLMNPKPLEQVGLGLVVSVAASPKSRRASPIWTINRLTTSGCLAATFVVSPMSASRSYSSGIGSFTSGRSTCSFHLPLRTACRSSAAK